MSKHVIDHPKSGQTTRRAKEYKRIEADERPRPQTRKLQQRSRTTNDAARLKAYTDIERRGDD
jgi:hypothetical protein